MTTGAQKNRTAFFASQGLIEVDPTATIEEDSNIILCPDCGTRHHHRADCEEAPSGPTKAYARESDAPPTSCNDCGCSTVGFDVADSDHGIHQVLCMACVVKFGADYDIGVYPCELCLEDVREDEHLGNTLPCGCDEYVCEDCFSTRPLPLQQTREEASALMDILDNYILDTEDKLALLFSSLALADLPPDADEASALRLLRDSLVAAGDALIRIRATMAGDLQPQQEQS